MKMTMGWPIGDLPPETAPEERSRTTLMDRVLVTPMKKSGHSSLRFGSHSKPRIPSRTFRHHSQRASSVAPYPKRSIVSYTTKNNSPPKARDNRLRRTSSDRSYFNGAPSEDLSSTKARLLMSRRDSTPRSSGGTRWPSRSAPIRAKSISGSIPSVSSTAFEFTSDTLYSGSDLGLSVVEGFAVDAMEAEPTQEMELELDFQALYLNDDDGRDPCVNVGDCSWSRIHDSPQPERATLSLADGLLSASASELRHEGLHLLVAHLRSALAAEVKARKLAEHQHLREKERRIEMEGLVTQLQHEREELLLDQNRPPSSSPLLLSSSPCISSKMVVNTALPLAR